MQMMKRVAFIEGPEVVDPPRFGLTQPTKSLLDLSVRFPHEIFLLVVASVRKILWAEQLPAGPYGRPLREPAHQLPAAPPH